MNPMTWNDLADIDDVPALDEMDEQCLAEIKTVIQKHGKEDRFGVTLLHRHFAMADDELLVEHCDVANRALVTRPQKESEVLDRNYRPTIWRFDRAKPQVCAYCPTHENDEGDSRHDGFKESH